MKGKKDESRKKKRIMTICLLNAVIRNGFIIDSHWQEQRTELNLMSLIQTLSRFADPYEMLWGNRKKQIPKLLAGSG
ncbi:GTP-binding protein 1 [Fusarium oxysporum f. sp. albedinis]|nr:GTP-binding protein 1 [Fusarium oxysporum f. sp. albedinis]